MLEKTEKLSAGVGLFVFEESKDFAGLLKELTGDGDPTLERKFERWLRRRAYRTVLDAVLGCNFGLGPFVFRLHFAKNIGIDAPAGLPVAPAEWVTNFSIGLVGLGGQWKQ